MFVNLMVWVVLFGSLLSYIIGICDSAQPFIHGTFLEERFLVAFGSDMGFWCFLQLLSPHRLFQGLGGLSSLEGHRVIMYNSMHKHLRIIPICFSRSILYTFYNVA